MDNKKVKELSDSQMIQHYMVILAWKFKYRCNCCSHNLKKYKIKRWVIKKHIHLKSLVLNLIDNYIIKIITTDKLKNIIDSSSYECNDEEEYWCVTYQLNYLIAIKVEQIRKYQYSNSIRFIIQTK